MYYLSISAIFRQETKWLKEWLDYHINRGVEHFYLYNNDLDPEEAAGTLKPYCDRGVVESIHVPENGIQLILMQDILKKAAGKTEWLALIDLDEFIFPRRNSDIREILDNYQKFSALTVNWMIYGTSGYHSSPPDQINHLLWRAEDAFSVNQHVKTILKPDLAIPECIPNPHAFYYHTGHAVGEKYQVVDSPFQEYSGEIIRINHYVLRSVRDYWDVKVKRGLASWSHDRGQEFFDHHDRNEVFDDEISEKYGDEVLTQKDS